MVYLYLYTPPPPNTHTLPTNLHVLIVGVSTFFISFLQDTHNNLIRKFQPKNGNFCIICVYEMTSVNPLSSVWKIRHPFQRLKGIIFLTWKGLIFLNSWILEVSYMYRGQYRFVHVFYLGCRWRPILYLGVRAQYFTLYPGQCFISGFLCLALIWA